MSSDRHNSFVDAQADGFGAVQVILGPERTVDVAALAAPDADSIAGRVIDDSSASPERDKLLGDFIDDIASIRQDPARCAALIARDRHGRLVALAGYRAVDGHRANLVCKLDRRYQGLGLGTFLLRRLAELALLHDIDSFHVDVAAPTGPLSDMLRDCGLRTRWDLDYPITRVDLELVGRRPGWATPECPTVAPTGG